MKVKSLSRVWPLATPWTAAYQAPPSNHLILCHPLLLWPPIPPSIRVFSSESTLLMRWPKYWSFSFSIRSSSKHQGLISFRIQDCKLPAGRESDFCPSQLLLAWSSLLSLGVTLSPYSWQMGRALARLLFEPEVQAPCSQACFVCFSFRKSNRYAVCWQLFLPLRAPQPARDKAHGGALHSLSQRQHPPHCQPGAQSECCPGARISAIPLHKPGRGCCSEPLKWEASLWICASQLESQKDRVWGPGEAGRRGPFWWIKKPCGPDAEYLSGFRCSRGFLGRRGRS